MTIGICPALPAAEAIKVDLALLIQVTDRLRLVRLFKYQHRVVHACLLCIVLWSLISVLSPQLHLIYQLLAVTSLSRVVLDLNRICGLSQTWSLIRAKLVLH